MNAAWYADFTLRLLLVPLESLCRFRSEWSEIDWSLFCKLARNNVVLVRTHDRLAELGVDVPDGVYIAAVKQERERIHHTLELIRDVGRICAREGIEYIFTKAFQHYPDMGHDVDLFVLDRSHTVDRLLVDYLGGMPGQGSLVSRLAGKTSYIFQGYDAPVEIHHGRLGHLGEHNVYPYRLIKHRRCVTIAGVTTFVPCSEDQLIIQVIQRIYGHFLIRLSDVAQSIGLIRDTAFDWDNVVSTTKELGIFDGLCCYVGYIDQIARSLGQVMLLPADISPACTERRWGKVRFDKGVYRFPTLAVSGRAYWNKLTVDLAAGNWEGLGKLSLLPPLAAFVGLRCLARAFPVVKPLRF